MYGFRGLGDTFTPVAVSTPISVVSPVAAGPRTITQAQIDASVALIAAMAAGSIPNADATSLTQICGECADPVGALTKWLTSANGVLEAGVTPASVIASQSSTISQVCGTAAARAKTLGLKTPCNPPSTFGSFLTDQLVPGVPNWGLGAGILAAFFLVRR